MVVLSTRFLSELKDLPDDVLSFSGAIDEVHLTSTFLIFFAVTMANNQCKIMYPTYTNVRSDRQIIPHVIKRDLTPGLSKKSETPTSN